jgi:chromosome segregation ATPase
MNSRFGVVVLVLLSIGLGVALIIREADASKQRQESAKTILNFSNSWNKASSDLEAQKIQAAILETNLENQKKALNQLGDELASHKAHAVQAMGAVMEYSNKWAIANVEAETQKAKASALQASMEGQKKLINDLTNNVMQLTASLNESRANLTKAESSLQSNQVELTRNAARIKELEGQIKSLDSQALELSAAITNLTSRIVETQQKLAASDRDKAAFEADLKRMTAEKTELDRRFNSLADVRAQQAKLARELSLARRIEWAQAGLADNRNGAALLFADEAELERRFGARSEGPAQQADLTSDPHISRRVEWSRQGVLARNNQKGGELLLDGFPTSAKSQ